MNTNIINRDGSKAMTLMEILIVIALIAVLAGVGVSNLSGVLASNKRKVAATFLKTNVMNVITSALALYDYPADLKTLSEKISTTKPDAKCDELQTHIAKCLNVTGIDKIPCPVTGTPWKVTVTSTDTIGGTIVFTTDETSPTLTGTFTYTSTDGNLKLVIEDTKNSANDYNN